jgi:hypothetical protein
MYIQRSASNWRGDQVVAISLCVAGVFFSSAAFPSLWLWLASVLWLRPPSSPCLRSPPLLASDPPCISSPPHRQPQSSFPRLLRLLLVVSTGVSLRVCTLHLLGASLSRDSTQ